MKWTPRLRTVLLLVNVIILAMPLGAIAALRIYDSELIRQTEAELIAQGAFVQATFRNALRRTAADAGEKMSSFGVAPTRKIELIDDQFIPVTPRLDANDDNLLPPSPDPVESEKTVSPTLAKVGLELEPILEEAQQITFAGIRIVDQHGSIVASTAGERGTSIGDHEEVTRALTGEFVSLLRRRMSYSPRPPLESISRGNRVRVFVAMPVLIDDRVVGAVVLSRTPMGISKALYQRRHVFLSMLAVLLFGVLLITLLTVTTIQRPIRALIRQTRQLADDPSGATDIDNPGTREFQELSHAFASMARSLHERETYLTSFARNVSHEFKTPLTSIRGSIELLQDHIDTMSAEERDDFLDVVAQDCDRLDRLVGDMLALARADVQRPGRELTKVRDVLDEAQTVHGSDDFEISVECSDDAVVAMDRDALTAVITNFLSNSKTHGASAATISVTAASTGVTLEVSDNGPGVPEDVAHRIFEEFFTTARDRGGTGLGLAIIQSMIQSHGGSVRLTKPESATFEVTLPSEK